MRRPHIAIMVAAVRGRGVSLTAEEVAWLSNDDAMSSAATERLTPADLQEGYRDGKFDWRKVKP